MFGLNPAADSIESVLEDSVVSSSRGLGWDGFEVMSARIPGDGFEVDGLRSHTLAINVGRPFALEARIDGRTGDGAMPTGAMKIVAAGPRSVWRWRSEAPALTWLIGGPDGLDASLKAQATLCVRLSSLTLPHAMVRVLLAEQLYRAWSVNANHPYHRV